MTPANAASNMSDEDSVAIETRYMLFTGSNGGASGGDMDEEPPPLQNGGHFTCSCVLWSKTAGPLATPCMNQQKISRHNEFNFDNILHLALAGTSVEDDALKIWMQWTQNIF